MVIQVLLDYYSLILYQLGMVCYPTYIYTRASNRRHLLLYPAHLPVVAKHQLGNL